MSREEWTFERVAGSFGFTEGPVWDGSGIIFSDLEASTIRRYDRESETAEVVAEGTNGGNGLKFGPDGRLYVCESEAHRVCRYELDGTRTVVADEFGGTPLNAPNDLAVDGAGDVWFSDPNYGDEERPLAHRSVYRVDPADPDDLQRVTEDTTQPNGLLVSPDGGTLYVAQSDYRADEPTELRAYPIRPDGTLGAYEVLHNFHPHRGIDGMCFTAGGDIVAAAGWPQSGPGAMLYVFEPSGRVRSTHPFPERGGKPTNCAFGGPDRSILYVTCSEGLLFRARTRLTGLRDAPDTPRLPW
ncbi:MAG: SMP-30/gluconolactonase/LRE family protein [Haloplanus sp.]